MSRRSALPGADELFRSTGDGTGRSPESRGPAPEVGQERPPVAPPGAEAQAAAQRWDDGDRVAVGSALRDEGPPLDAVQVEAALDAPRSSSRRRPRVVSDRRPTGRERHDEKITVYVSQDELMDLEHARLMLRGDHGLPVDRGRVVREALAVVLADFEAKGEASILVRRLRGR